MTAAIFKMWVKKLDSQMQKSNRNIALVLDNCTAHPKVKGLTNITLIFLPLTQQQETSQWMLGLFDASNHIIEKILVALEKKDSTINILEGTKLLSNAWNAISEATIKNRFKKVNFIQAKDNQDINFLYSLNRTN